LYRIVSWSKYGPLKKEEDDLEPKNVLKKEFVDTTDDEVEKCILLKVKAQKLKKN
jgi:hypothetical protein